MTGPPDAAALAAKADAIRRDVVETAVANGAGHIAPSLSTVDLLVALHYDLLDIPAGGASSPRWGGRDRLVLSKAHGCYALYAILADRGILPAEHWRAFYRGGPLSGCAERHEAWGLEASCGSLGHGLPIAAGLAFGARELGLPWRTVCLVGDGEMQEGSCWEAVLFAAKHRLRRLTLLVDDNGLQAMERTSDVLDLTDDPEELRGKLAAFGFLAAVVDGHDLEAFRALFRALEAADDPRPRAIVARTVKGYGLACMENVPKFHFRLPTPEELARGKRYER